MKKIIFLICVLFTVSVSAETNQTEFDKITCESTLVQIQNVVNGIDTIKSCTGDFVLYGNGRLAVFQIHFYTSTGIKVVLNSNLWDDWNPDLHKKITNIVGRKEVVATGKLERSAYKQVIFRYAECEQITLYFKVENLIIK